MKSWFRDLQIKKRPLDAASASENSPQHTSAPLHAKTSRWRAATLITLNLLMVAHIVQWRLMGTTVSPIEPAEAMYTIQRGVINAGFIFFSLAILTTLIFGRFFCGWACHMVSLQDLCTWLLKKMGLRPKPFRSRLLIYVPLIAGLYMFVWPTAVRYFTKPKTDPLIPQFTNHLVTTEFWATFPPVAVAIPFLFICGFMTVYFLGSKGFCTYGCPYGGFYKIIDRFSPGKIRVTDACDQCGKCTAICTSNVRVHAEVKHFGMVVDPNCHRAMDCISICPQNALYFGFGKPAIGVSGSNIRKAYSLTWPEEIFGACVFLASFFAVWDVYHLIPMLMSLGIALVTTFLVLKAVRLPRSEHLSFYRFILKSSGRIKSAGWIFLGLAVIWIGLNAHSGWVRYNEHAGAVAYESIHIADELALAQANPESWLSEKDRRNITDGKKKFDAAASAGFFVNKESLSKRAWLEYLSGDPESSVELLAAAAERSTGQSRALSLYYRGAILNRLGKHNEALANLDQALSERADLVAAREEKGESLWQLGQRQAAVQAWNDAVRSNQNLVVANLMLAGAAWPVDPKKAMAYEEQARKSTPNDASFHWMLGLRLQNVRMSNLAESHFRRAIQIDPNFNSRRPD